jgi:hypothetical protein
MKWITAAQLERWAETLAARAQLPGLIRALVRASTEQISTIRFPSEEKSQVHGFDGHLVAAGVPFVQDGESYWEFGTSDEYLAKANKSVKERSEQTPDEKRATASFVFVTPRTWNKPAGDENELQKWRERNRSDRGWKEVVVIDAVMLEDWLEQRPPVAARYARYELALVPTLGARSTDEYWDEYTSRFKMAPTEQLFLCERDEARAGVLKHLRSGPGPLELRADSPDEAIAFAIAAIRASDPDLREFLESRTIVIDTAEAARELATTKDLIFIPRGNVTITGQLARLAATLIAVGRDRPELGSYVRLDRPTSTAFAAALQGMGLLEETSSLLARSCGRSVTVLMRLFPNGDVGVPQWAKQGPVLIPALLSGAWDSASQEDKRVVCKLAGTDAYEKYEAELRQFQRMDDPPIDREGTVWKMRAPVDAFVHLGHLLGDENFVRFKDVMIEVFSEIDPSLSADSPPKAWEQPKPRYSSWLRDGLATTLLQFAVNHEGASLQISGTTPQAFVDELVKSLPGLSSDARITASLRNELPLLMEAAPRPFLKAIDSLLAGDGQLLIPMFREGGFFSSFSPHTYLLWGLEALAWDPEYLVEVSLVLAKLARIDPGGNLSNRPINTLIEIFLPWHPNTNASQEQRLAALDLIVREVPEVGWTLISKLLPTMHSVGQNTAKPKYREAGGSGKEILTRGMVLTAYETIISKAFGLAGDHPDRWSYLIRDFTNFSPKQRSELSSLLEKFLKRAPEGNRKIVWTAIRDELNRHSTYKEARWALPAAALQPLSRLVEQFAPSDPKEKVTWLFDDQFPVLSGSDRDPERAVNDARRQALAEIVNESGIEAVLGLAESVKLPHTVAFTLALLALDVAAYERLFELSLRSEAEKLWQFSNALSGAAAQRFPGEWPKVFQRQITKNKLPIERIVALLQYWPDTRPTWEFVASLSREQDEAYWSKKPAWPIRARPDDLIYAAEHYMKCARFVAAIESFGEEAATLPKELVFALLNGAVNELNRTPTAATGMFTYYLEQILDALEKSGAATISEIASVEWAFFPLFEYGQRRQLRLHRVMAQDPKFYVSLICAVFRAEDEEPSEPSPEERARATAAYRLLQSFGELPGRKGETIDSEQLGAWVRDVRRLGQEAKRRGMTEEFIGHVLAHAPVDPNDEAWPHMSVRDLLEDLRSDETERGIQIERFNMRGVYSKALFEGGKQERGFSVQYREWAAKCDSWPRTQKTLRQIAEEWVRHAEWEDAETRKDRMRD